MARLVRTSLVFRALGLLALCGITLFAGAAACGAMPSARPSSTQTRTQTSPAQTPGARSYPDSADGLRQFLGSLLAAAKGTDPGRLDALMVDMEIPDVDSWFRDTFGPKEGASDADLYRRTLDANENNFEKLLQQLARQSGEFQVRRVNDAPRGLESVMLRNLRGQPDVYFVAWKARGNSAGAGASAALAYPYFLFVDGKFRWDSLQRDPGSSDSQAAGVASRQISESSIPRRSSAAPFYQPTYVPPDEPPQQAANGTRGPVNGPIHPPPLESSSQTATQPEINEFPTSSPTAAPPASAGNVPGKNGVGYPACISCPSPNYPPGALAERLEGRVLLRATIEVDGRASGISLVSTDALVFDEPAISAVRNWRFKPAAGPDGKPVPVVTEIEVRFRVPQSTQAHASK